VRPITFEEAPLAYTGDMVDVTRNFSAGFRAIRPRGGRLEFSYELEADGGPPKDPRSALRNALRAYHDAGFPGRYDLLQAGGYLHVVPIGRANEQGVFERIQSPLDAYVTIHGANRYPMAVLQELARRMEESKGYPVVMGRTPFFAGMQPVIEENFEQVEARAVLRALIQASQRPRIWYLLFDLSRKQYVLSIP
jgi:hypothetical protein